MPDSFPSDDIPVLSDANIINVYENDDKTNVRIMFGTGKSMMRSWNSIRRIS